MQLSKEKGHTIIYKTLHRKLNWILGVRSKYVRPGVKIM